MVRRRKDFVRGPALLALVLFGVAGCHGCGSDPEAYPDNFPYPSRQERLVVELPKEAPNKAEPPGELDESIQRINQLGGKVLDPATVAGPLREELNRFLLANFGSPAHPTIAGDDQTKSLAG